jgi:hypothetical protein
MNPECRALNYTPLFAIHGFSNCTKCYWVLPEPFYVSYPKRFARTIASAAKWIHKHRRWLLGISILSF